MANKHEKLIAEGQEAYDILMSSLTHDQYPADVMLNLINALKGEGEPTTKFVDVEEFVEDCRRLARNLRRGNADKLRPHMAAETIELMADKIEGLASRLNDLTIPTASTHILTPNEKFLWDQHYEGLKIIASLAKRLDEIDAFASPTKESQLGSEPI